MGDKIAIAMARIVPRPPPAPAPSHGASPSAPAAGLTAGDRRPPLSLRFRLGL
jgi:hypothetical protein